MFSGSADFETIASTSGHEVVYGCDENGNQVPIALILKGNFNDNVEFNAENDQVAMNWNVCQEECITTKDDSSSDIKEEIVDEDEKIIQNNITSTKNKVDISIKTYKMKPHSRKTLKKIKEQIKGRKLIKGNMKKKSETGKKKIKANSVKRRNKEPVRKSRKSRNNDKAYSPGYNVSKMHLACKIFVTYLNFSNLKKYYF